MCLLTSKETLGSGSSRFGTPHESEKTAYKRAESGGDTWVNFEEGGLASTKRSFAYSFCDLCRSGCHLRA